jgi:hypothetical protein
VIVSALNVPTQNRSRRSLATLFGAEVEHGDCVVSVLASSEICAHRAHLLLQIRDSIWLYSVPNDDDRELFKIESATASDTTMPEQADPSGFRATGRDTPGLQHGSECGKLV